MKPVAIAFAFAATLSGCARIPKGIEPVRGFEAERYLGAWYEIARLENRFERGLTHVKATYSPNEDGTIRVRNQGYDPAHWTWREAIGRAKPAGDPSVGRLKVSFFGPFYAGYNILELDPDYRHALVCGGSRGYLWILAREPHLPDATRDRLVSRARDLGFAADELLFVSQDNPPGE